MVRLLFALVAALCLLAVPKAGHATLVQLDYVSRPLFCIDASRCTLGSSYTERGTIFIDTDILPGGNLRDTTIGLAWAWHDGPFRRYTINGPSDSFSGDIPVTDRSDLDWTSIGIVPTGYFAEDLFGYTVDAGRFIISFNALGQVSYWTGRNMVGGCDDPATGPTRDSTWCTHTSYGPGRWTVTGMPPIPLPASALLLLTGFAGLLLARFLPAVRTRVMPPA